MNLTKKRGWEGRERKKKWRATQFRLSIQRSFARWLAMGV